MSKETKAGQKRRDARRSDQQSAKGNLYQKKHPEWARDRMRKIRAECGRNDGIYAHMVDELRNPITITSNNIIVASDFHIPFHNPSLLENMYDVAIDYGVEDVAVPGDFWDCDNFSIFDDNASLGVTFKKEQKHVAGVLEDITNSFKRVYFCKGNHEDRWVKINSGQMDMKDLFATTLITEGYEVTSDDHMILMQNGEKWLLCHPKNFRTTPLSVAKDLAAKKLCHIWVGHGHQFAQGWDRSGRFRVVDGGGIFDPHSLAYHRRTTCHPEMRSGFYLLQDNIPHPYEPDHTGTVRLKGEVRE